MEILSFNISWMAFNIFLALVAAIAGRLIFKLSSTPLIVIVSVVWFAFLPNTIYVLTDFQHLIAQWNQLNSVELRILLLFEYALLFLSGLILYIVSYYPAEIFLKRIFSKHYKFLSKIFLVLLNYLIGFGIVLGRIERVNSWWIITQTHNVILSVFTILRSPEQLILAVLFGMFANYFYFSFRKPVLNALKIK